MTDNEIKKALECCSEQKCLECPFEPVEHPKKTFGCSDEMMLKSLDLINRLQAENERLTERIIEIQRCDKELIETLHKVHKEKTETAKAEAYKEFAERLKESSFTINQCEEILLKESIDNLLKELKGDS